MQCHSCGLGELAPGDRIWMGKTVCPSRAIRRVGGTDETLNEILDIDHAELTIPRAHGEGDATTHELEELEHTPLAGTVDAWKPEDRARYSVTVSMHHHLGEQLRVTVVR